MAEPVASLAADERRYKPLISNLYYRRSQQPYGSQLALCVAKYLYGKHYFEIIAQGKWNV